MDEANDTGNYTVLRDLSAPGFRDTNNAARLAEIFASLRHDKVDLSGVVALEPQLTVLPQVDGTGMMRMAGFFPSVPTQVNFDLVYAPVEGRWRLFGLSVRLSSSSPVAPAPPPNPTAKAPRPVKPAVTKPKTRPKRPEPTKPDDAKPNETKPPAIEGKPNAPTSNP